MLCAVAECIDGEHLMAGYGMDSCGISFGTANQEPQR